MAWLENSVHQCNRCIVIRAPSATSSDISHKGCHASQVLQEKWASLAEPERESFRTQHAALRDSAQKIGVLLPAIGDPASLQVIGF